MPDPGPKASNSHKNSTNNDMTDNLSPFEKELRTTREKRWKAEKRRAERSRQNLEDYIRSKTKTRSLEKKLLKAVIQGKTEIKLFNLPKRRWLFYNFCKGWDSLGGWDSLDGLDSIIQSINDGFGTKAMCINKSFYSHNTGSYDAYGRDIYEKLVCIMLKTS